MAQSAPARPWAHSMSTLPDPPSPAAPLRRVIADAQLALEITETTLTHRLDSALAVLGALCELGVGLGVDDCGTCHSSLSRLSTLPITSVKIDCSCAQRLQAGQSDSRDTEVVRAAITLGHHIGAPGAALNRRCTHGRHA